MSNLDNNVNINKASHAYTHKVSKSGKNVPVSQHEEISPEPLNDGIKAADSYGRILVKSGKIENPEMVQAVKDSIEFFERYPEIAAATVKSVDDAEELLEALEVSDAFEKACCGAYDAAYSKIK